MEGIDSFERDGSGVKEIGAFGWDGTVVKGIKVAWKICKGYGRVRSGMEEMKWVWKRWKGYGKDGRGMKDMFGVWKR